MVICIIFFNPYIFLSHSLSVIFISVKIIIFNQVLTMH